MKLYAKQTITIIQNPVFYRPGDSMLEKDCNWRSKELSKYKAQKLRKYYLVNIENIENRNRNKQSIKETINHEWPLLSLQQRVFEEKKQNHNREQRYGCSGTHHRSFSLPFFWY